MTIFPEDLADTNTSLIAAEGLSLRNLRVFNLRDLRGKYSSSVFCNIVYLKDLRICGNIP